MGIEIERKFLVRGESWRKGATGNLYRQGYLSTDKMRTVRVRSAAGKGYITIKGISTGASRAEYEYEIPVQEAEEILSHLCERPLLEKKRYRIPHGSLTWEVDEFMGENQGLITAEVELTSEGQHIDLPDWAGEEVTGKPRYFNSNLVNNPYSRWWQEIQ